MSSLPHPVGSGHEKAADIGPMRCRAPGRAGDAVERLSAALLMALHWAARDL